MFIPQPNLRSAQRSPFCPRNLSFIVERTLPRLIPRPTGSDCRLNAEVILRPMLRKIVVAACLAFALTACSSSPSGGRSTPPPQPKPEVKQTEAETGRVVLQRLFTTSRGWSSDTEPVSIQSQNYKNAGGNPNAPLGHDGKSAIWRGLFAAPARHSMKTYMWSGLTGPDAPSPGINPGSEDSFSATNSSTQPFEFVY